jgi:alpha-ketoglutaric semialdehyde dehydrogenase|tara:strand:- start:5684 stop:7249 length:1566 start_codon:yes stop_codon:yes gene_type:complete
MIKKNIIGFSISSEGDSSTQGFNPKTGEPLPGDFSNANYEEVNLAVEKATEAFETYRKISGKKKSLFLNAIADEIENLGELLIERCCAESGLPNARIVGERGRTVGQLRMFANLISEGSWLEASIEIADMERKPIPKPDIRKMLVPMGPVVVFAASNFPLAFSTAGGDTASALAGGNPVIVKAHSAHPGTSAFIGSAIMKAAKNTGMPDGVFSLLHGSGKVVGQSLISHSGVKAAGFTGSQVAGRILFDLANQRKEPIPFFAEMGSVNPVLLLPTALNLKIVEMLSTSITMGSGQFCTNPGLLLTLESDLLEQFINDLGRALEKIEPGVMLTEKICKTYYNDVGLSLSNQDVKVESEFQDKNKLNIASSVLVSVSGESFLKNPKLAEEVFGPYSMIVKCKNKDQLNNILTTLNGQLTGTVIGSEDEMRSFILSINQLEKKVGRLIFNNVPTGVEVCSSMQHGGPYPASSDSRFTSVGTMAIKRFVRPVAFQSWPDSQLPDELKNDNPLNIWRLINGEWTMD